MVDILGVTAVKNSHLLPCILEPSQVNTQVFLDNGYHTARAGVPDFYWVVNATFELF